jgi:hypothetical protein
LIYPNFLSSDDKHHPVIFSAEKSFKYQGLLIVLWGYATTGGQSMQIIFRKGFYSTLHFELHKSYLLACIFPWIILFFFLFSEF